MTTQTFIAPDGKLYTYKKYVNWEGVREVVGSKCASNGKHTESIPEESMIKIGSTVISDWSDFTIQD